MFAFSLDLLTLQCTFKYKAVLFFFSIGLLFCVEAQPASREIFCTPSWSLAFGLFFVSFSTFEWKM